MNGLGVRYAERSTGRQREQPTQRLTSYDAIYPKTTALSLVHWSDTPLW